MRYRKAFLVFRKDWREISRNWQVILPVLVVPFTISVLLPVLIGLIPSLATTSGSSLSGLEAMTKNLPDQAKNELVGMTDRQVLVYVMSLYFFAPFFLIIPVMASSVIASDSFAGEKERRTIEALLATPISDGELFLGKILVSFIPSMMITMISFLAYSAVVDAVSMVLLGRFLLPNLVWVMLIFGLAPTMAFISIGLTVMISARVKGFREAQQISAVLLIPILLILFGQASGALILGPLVIAVLIALFATVSLLIFRVGVRVFQREEILSRLA